MKAQSSGPPEYRVPPPHHPLQNPELTLAGAEAEPTVSVKVSSGAAPEHVVRAAVCGAGGVGATIEGEGEVAGSAIRVPKAGWNHCRRRGDQGQGGWPWAWEEKGVGSAVAQDLTDALAQGPQLFIVEVGVSLDALARGEGVRQEPVLPVEGIPISVL